MSDNRTWQYEPEAGSAVANICEYEGARCIRFVCEFIDPPSAEDAALMIAGKNEVAALRAELAELRARVAVPDDVAKDAERYRWIRSDMKMLWGDDVLAIIGESGASFDAAIDAAILAADTEGRKDE